MLAQSTLQNATLFKPSPLWLRNLHLLPCVLFMSPACLSSSFTFWNTHQPLCSLWPDFLPYLSLDKSKETGSARVRGQEPEYFPSRVWHMFEQRQRCWRLRVQTLHCWSRSPSPPTIKTCEERKINSPGDLWWDRTVETCVTIWSGHQPRGWAQSFHFLFPVWSWNIPPSLAPRHEGHYCWQI